MESTSTAGRPDARVIQTAHRLEVAPRDVLKRVGENFVMTRGA